MARRAQRTSRVSILPKSSFARIGADIGRHEQQFIGQGHGFEADVGEGGQGDARPMRKAQYIGLRARRRIPGPHQIDRQRHGIGAALDIGRA